MYNRRNIRRKKPRALPIGKAAFLFLALFAMWTALILTLWSRMDEAARAIKGYHQPQAPAATPTPQPPEEILLDVPFIDQREKYPTGCESVAAAMALQYWGLDVTPDDLIAAMPKGTAPQPDGSGGYSGCDPRKAFPGDPYTYTGWGCYAPVVQQTTEDILRERDVSSLSIISLEDAPLSDLESYLQAGDPVLIWVTIGMETPEPDITFTIEGTGETFQWIYPMHCVVLVGADDTNYYLNDPLEGKAVPYLKEAVRDAYDGLGRQALVFSKP